MSFFLSLASISILLGLLVVGKNYLIPIVIALLMASVIGATADRMQARGMPQPIAIMIAVLLAIFALITVMRIVAGQADAVVDAWPSYVTRLENLIEAGSEWVGPNLSDKIGEALDNLNIANLLPRLVGTAGSILSSFGLVLLYVAFLLAERSLTTGKVERLFSTPEKAAEAKQTIDRISAGIREYMWIKTLMSLLTAGVSYIVLKALAIDFSEMWALLIFLLNYIPSIGSILGVVFPALLAIVQFDTMWQFLTIALVLSSAQFFIGNVIEPIFLGRSLNMSPFAVILSLTFWGTIWGLVGAFLSVPLTVAIMIICSNVPAWRWVAVLLSEDGRINGAEHPQPGGAQAETTR